MIGKEEMPGIEVNIESSGESPMDKIDLKELADYIYCVECGPELENTMLFHRNDGCLFCPICGTKKYTIDGKVSMRCLDDLTDISGVGESRAEQLVMSGYATKQHLRNASQDELAEILGNALAARVKADVGGINEN